ncbi:MAG: hypothetical protein KAS78_02380 [Candidatus Pacebacteria bacterium]|nr:hypothetical protein [Candidatus Paceibacterota bacterium]
MIKNKIKIGLVFALVMMFGMTSLVGASNLTYSNDTTIDLTTADFTISANSTAGGVVVNADNIVVTMGVGDTFTVTNSTKGFDVSGSNANVTVSNTCSGGVGIVVVNSSTGTGDYTISSAATQCPTGGGGGGTYTPPTPEPEPTPDTPTSTTGEVEATADGGGSVSNTSEDGTTAEVVLPTEAVTSATTVTIIPVTKATVAETHPVSTGSSVVGGYVYNFNAVSGTTAVSTFEKALTVTLTYTDAQVAGLTEGTLKIHYWDDTSSEWVALTDSAVNTTTNTVTATTTHFTYFVILGTQTSEDETPETPTTPTTPSTEVIDGDIIQCASSSNPFAVYIVKTVGDTKYIRHIVSLEIFDYYGHLKWENLKQVDSLSEYSLSGWARVNTGPNGTPGPTDKVYEINGDQSKHWINMTAEDFLAHGGSAPAIYTVNQGEMDLYTTGPDVMSL